jgi:alcohol dehydrogenase (cytochrome c)
MIKSTGETRFVKGEGKFLHGATTSMIMNPPPSGWISALDSDTGMIKWKYHAAAPIVAGITATAGGLVLTGDTAGMLLILDSATGQVLYRKDTGGAIAGGVVTYAIDGKQYIAFTSGSVSRSSLGVIGVPTIVVLALDGATRRPHADRIEHGGTLYAQNCAGCHGASGEGGSGKSLKNLAARRTAESTIQWLKDPRSPMPRLFPSPLSEGDVRDIAAYIRLF